MWFTKRVTSRTEAICYRRFGGRSPQKLRQNLNQQTVIHPSTNRARRRVIHWSRITRYRHANTTSIYINHTIFTCTSFCLSLCLPAENRLLVGQLRLSIRVCVIFSERELMFMFAICRRPSVCRLSVVCLSVVCRLYVGAPYSSDWNFRQCFYAIWYPGHLWPFGKNFTEIIPGEPLRRGVKPKRGRKM